MQSDALEHPNGGLGEAVIGVGAIISGWPLDGPHTDDVFSSETGGIVAGGIDMALALMPPARLRTASKRTPPDRTQLERALSRIEESISTLIGQGADQAGFWLALSKVVFESLGRAKPADDEWIAARLGAILAMHGIR